MKSRKSKFIIYVFLIIGTLVVLVPFIWMILTSFKDNKEILIKIPPTFFPEKFYFGGYTKVITGAPFFTWVFNSLFVAVCITAATVFTSALVGYIYAKFDFVCKRISFIIILATLMVPFEVIMIPEYIIIAKLGLLNSLKALIIPSLVSAFGIFLCKQFSESLPNDLISAGRIDGSSEFGIFIKIVVPEIRPAMSALAIFSFMGSWNNYMWPLIVISDINKMPVSLAIDYFNGIHRTQPTTVMSAAVLVMVPVLIVYLIFQRQFIEGLALTGIK